MTLRDERFPQAEVIVAERFGGDAYLCGKCHLPLDDGGSHFPDELGGGCLPCDETACEYCWGVESHEPFCELARWSK